MPESPAPSLPIRALLLIALVGLCLRLLLFGAGVWQDPTRAMSPDSQIYRHLANNLREHGELSLAEEQISGLVHVPLQSLRDELGQREPLSPAGLHPETFRTPGYPLAIAAVNQLGGSVRAVILMQILLGSAAIFLVGLLAFHLAGPSRGVACLAACVVAINPATILSDNMLLSESLFVTLLLGALCCVAIAQKVWAMVPGGLLLGLATLVRPVGVAIGFCLAFWMLVTRPSWQSVRLASVMLVASLLLPAIWIGRNMTVGAGPTLATVPAVNAYFYTAAHMDITAAGGDTFKDWPATVERYHARLAAERLPDEAVYDTMTRLGKQRIADDPKLFATMMLNSAAKYFTDHSISGITKQLGITLKSTGMRDRLMRGDFSLDAISPKLLLFGAAMGFNALLCALTFAGVAILFVQRRFDAACLIAGLVVYFLLACNVYGLERFRLPAVGLQAIAAAHALCVLGNILAAWRAKRPVRGTGAPIPQAAMS